MTSDRQLLERAAKAAGIEWIAHAEFLSGAPYLRATNVPLGIWAPLTDDGDALRLAVKLQIDFYTHADGLAVAKLPGELFEEWHAANADPYAATRRAIVRAAASLGEHK